MRWATFPLGCFFFLVRPGFFLVRFGEVFGNSWIFWEGLGGGGVGKKWVLLLGNFWGFLVSFGVFFWEEM